MKSGSEARRGGWYWCRRGFHCCTIVCSDVVVVLSNVDFVLQRCSLFVNEITVNGRLTMLGTERRFVLGKGGPF